jgi:ATPase subunit of ABC transporter with duplicated ATPase domains
MAWNTCRRVSAGVILARFRSHPILRSHDRAFLDAAVATDIIHQHSGRLDYYQG